MSLEEIYKDILNKAKEDPDVVGFILAGGRGKGIATANSDYDIMIVVEDEAKEKAVENYEKTYNSTEKIEAHVIALENFKTYGNWGAPESWEGYNFSHLKAQIDKTGEIQKLINEKGVIPEKEVGEFVNLWLGGFINQYYRALKNDRDKNVLAARLDATESIYQLLNVLFGREGRFRPYNKFLEWELNNYPLQHLPWTSMEFIELIKKVLNDGDIEVMKDLYQKVRESSLEMGFREAIQVWDGCKMD